MPRPALLMIKNSAQSWLVFWRAGDWLVAFIGLAIIAISIPFVWQSGDAETVIIKKGGEIVERLPLSRNKLLVLQGPLGTTQIQIKDKKVRVLSDPGIHQYCVKQGWLSRNGEIAICAPTQISVQIGGSGKGYDSISY